MRNWAEAGPWFSLRFAFALDFGAAIWYVSAMDKHELAVRLGAARGNAKRRGHVFTLTKDEWLRLYFGPCVYGSGEPAYGLDRMDSDQGYTLANTSSCCARHNVIKGRVFTHAEMLRLVADFESARACGHGRMKIEGRRGGSAVSDRHSLTRQGRTDELIHPGKGPHK
jgi:hypothetical protein